MDRHRSRNYAPSSNLLKDRCLNIALSIDHLGVISFPEYTSGENGAVIDGILNGWLHATRL